MQEKKQRILEESIKLFVRKGYHATSIQEIVEQSGVSKGAFYLYFASKEALTAEIVDYYVKMVMEKLDTINEEEGTPEDKLVKQTALFLQLVSQHKGYMLMSVRDNLNVGENIDQIAKQVIGKIYHLTRQHMLDIYGQKIIPYLMDCSVIYDGLMQGYIKVIVLYELQFDPDQLATFIVERLKSVVLGLLEDQPSPQMTEEQLGIKQADTGLSIAGHCDQLRAEIARLDRDPEEKSQLQDIVVLLKRELRKDESNPMLLRGIIHELSAIPELYQYIQVFKQKIIPNLKG
ncbi:TetR/AcrR family transcriptional regulator [Amphibacillus cookii]|uniref:TetR/AcrR family transcriptional regulator n=1 Tax=Amphibacillus cookii TaxID=767787 RepID=UPI00195CC817|nr:TetR/AcrR family transcriptional regulator [Amphibacillus cookii]MBM7539850.1 AcrR family transcriptional regulator [Amphibacillus cookii]